MVSEIVALSTQDRNYETPKGNYFEKNCVTTSPPSGPLSIDTHILDIVPHLPNGMIPWLIHNPSARATQNYNIVEDIAQAPCVKSSLDFLKICLMHHKSLLLAIGGKYPLVPNIISLYVYHKDP
jgi:hypothetical protein